MPRFTDILPAKLAVSVEVAPSSPIPPAPTASAPFGVAPAPSLPAGASSIAQGGAPTGLATSGSSSAPTGPLIRSDQPQPQPRMQTTQSLPESKAPGAPKAFTPPKAPSAAPKLPKPAAPPAAKTAWRFKPASVLAPPAPGVLSHLTEGLGMHPQALEGGLVNKAMGAMDAYGRASTLFGIPGMVAEGASWLKDKVTGSPATEALEARKSAAFGVSTEPLPPGAMPPSPMGSLTDLIEPLKHPVQTAKNFVTGLGAEADRQLTQAMVERPVEAHQLMYQIHPMKTN